MAERQTSTQKARIICGFAGVGKSFLLDHPSVRQTRHANLAVEDIDSSAFSKIDGKPNPAWPGNYMAFIRERAKAVDVIMMSTHLEIREALVEYGIPYTLVYPAKDLKAEYLERYRARGSPPILLKIFDNEWDNFINQCQSQGGCKHVVLQRGEYIANVIDEIMANGPEIAVTAK